MELQAVNDSSCRTGTTPVNDAVREKESVIGGLFSKAKKWFTWHKRETAKMWELVPIIATKGEGFAGKKAKTGYPDIGMAHESTFFDGGSSIATDQALVQELRRNGARLLHAAIADGFGHPPQEDELRCIAEEAREVLTFASLPQVNSTEDYQNRVHQHLEGLCRDPGNAITCRFAYGACLIESLAWRKGNTAHVRFGGFGDSIGIVINGKGKVLLATPFVTTKEGQHLSIAFNEQAIRGKEAKYAFFLDKEFQEDHLLVITASDGLADAFRGEEGFDPLLLEEALERCSNLQPQQLATFLYEEVEKSVERSVNSVEKGQPIPFAGDDTTIIVTQI
jgi:hypothetical protein